jgi:hypothetical protein
MYSLRGVFTKSRKSNRILNEYIYIYIQMYIYIYIYTNVYIDGSKLLEPRYRFERNFYNIYVFIRIQISLSSNLACIRMRFCMCTSAMCSYHANTNARAQALVMFYCK